MRVGEDAEKRQPLCTVGGNINWCSNWENRGGILQKLKTEPPSISFLSLLKENTVLTQKGIFTPMFIAAFFTIANKWKLPKCSTVEDWIKKMLYLLYTQTHIPNRILFSNKKGGNLVICCIMD